MEPSTLEADRTGTQVTQAGIVGLGAMGLQMAKHMVNKGFKVSGYDIAPEPASRGAEHGVTIYSSPAEVAKHAQVIIVMVQTDKQVEDVFLKAGVLESLAPGSVVCIASSVSPATCRQLEALGEERGIGVLDTPVVLGQEAANNGTMTVFVGGKEKWFHLAKPVLQTFGTHIIHLGE